MLAVIDHRMPRACAERLRELGFEVLPLPSFPLLSPPVASHPDMLLCRLGERLFCHEEYYKIAKQGINTILRASGLTLTLTDDEVSDTYPHDCGINVFFTGNILFGKADSMAKKLREYAEECKIPIENVKQGYAKCSSVVLEGAIITADGGIADAARKSGLDVLLVASGGVSLPPYSYGFLGGASGVCGKSVYFCGTLEKHKDADKIKAFCHEHGYEVISLSSDPLFDAGSILFF